MKKTNFTFTTDTAELFEDYTRVYNAVFERSRRQVLIGTGALAATGTGALAVSTQESSAKVSIQELSVADKEYTLTDESISDVRVSVDSTFSWDGNAKANSYELELYVGSTPTNAETIATHSKDGLGEQALQGTETLQGSLLNTSIFDSDNFTPTTGQIETSVVFKVVFRLLRNGDVVEKAEATDSASVIVSKEELSYTVELSASGEISIKT